MKTVTNGFRLQRDKETKYHTLEVANKDYKWQIYIEPFPNKKWLYLSFSWHQENGLKLYFNGELTFQSNKPIPLRGILQKRNNEENIGNVMFIGRKDNLQEFNSSGNFQIAHLAIWKKVLSENNFKAAYSANVKMSPTDEVCCYNVRGMCVRFLFFVATNMYVCHSHIHCGVLAIPKFELAHTDIHTQAHMYPYACTHARILFTNSECKILY